MLGCRGVCVNVFVYVLVWICMYLYVYVCICKDIYTYRLLYVCMYKSVCMHTPFVLCHMYVLRFNKIECYYEIQTSSFQTSITHLKDFYVFVCVKHFQANSMNNTHVCRSKSGRDDLHHSFLNDALVVEHSSK